LIIAFSTSIVEIISPRGLDNLSIPLLVILILFLLRI
jgi:dolichol kinase